jgi:hypothetical protein
MAALRFAHLGILWVEEGYPMAAAQQMRRGLLLYRDVWFDKPPAFAWVYAAWGAESEWALRAAGFCFVLLAAGVAAWAARRVFGQGEALAAVLTAYFLTFDFPATAMALTPDLLTIPLHLAAFGLAAAGRPFAAGVCAGCGLLFNTKALLMGASVALFLPPKQWPRLVAGFLLPNAAFALYAQARGSYEEYWRQVWAWGAVYSRDTFVAHPLAEGARRTMNWGGFHAGLLLAAWLGWRKAAGRWRWAAALVLSLAAAWLGLRFFPRYYFLLLPPLILLAAAAWPERRTRVAWAAGLLLVAPLARFGPRFYQLALHPGAEWADAAMARDSRNAARALGRLARPGDRLLVWGYRPDIYALSRLPAATRFLDSQPVNGVLADRHLTSTHVSYPAEAARHRAEVLAGPMPSLIADGLGPYNPALAVFAPSQLGVWAGAYRPCAETKGTRIYCRKE